MDDLAVIDIELQLQVRDLEFDDQVAREDKIVEEVSGHVARVDRLDHDIEAVGREKFRGPCHRFVECLDRLAVAPVGDAGHQMQPLDAGRLGIGQCGVQALLEILKTLGQRGKAFFAGVPIARRQVE